jgi:hypothetical protein
MRRLTRLAFWGYAVVLFVATHWPNLRIDSAYMERPDILIHMGAFGVWTLLLISTGYLATGASDPLAESKGVRGWARIVSAPRCVLIAWLVAMVYAAVDEVSQGLPGLGRTAAWDDYAADSAGIVTAAVGAMVVGAVTKPTRRPGAHWIR